MGLKAVHTIDIKQYINNTSFVVANTSLIQHITYTDPKVGWLLFRTVGSYLLLWRCCHTFKKSVSIDQSVWSTVALDRLGVYAMSASPYFRLTTIKIIKSEKENLVFYQSNLFNLALNLFLYHHSDVFMSSLFSHMSHDLWHSVQAGIVTYEPLLPLSRTSHWRSIQTAVSYK